MSLIDEREHLIEIEFLRHVAKLAATEIGPRMPALLEYLARLETDGIRRLVPESVKQTWAVPLLADALVNRYALPDDLRLCLDEERALAEAFSAFSKVAIDVTKKHEVRKGLSVEEWARILRSTAGST